jgi:hypothetical protein
MPVNFQDVLSNDAHDLSSRFRCREQLNPDRSTRQNRYADSDNYQRTNQPCYETTCGFWHFMRPFVN